KNKTSDCPRFRWKSGAGNETRTRDPDLGKVVLYQLSYSRASRALYDMNCRSQLPWPLCYWNPSSKIVSQPTPLAPALRSANVSATRISSIAKVEVWPPNSIQLKCSAGTVTVFLLLCPLPVRLSAVLGPGSMAPAVGSSQNVIAVPLV